MKILSLASRYVRALLDLLLPRMCIVCGEKLLIDERHLCLECLMNLPYTHFWERSHNPMADKFNDVLQKELEKAWEEELRHERYAYACALFFYNSDANFRLITQELKYRRNIEAGRHFGRMLGKKLALGAHFGDVNMVIPVPLHWRRMWKRGYNQAEIIAAEVASALGAELRTNALKRTRYTLTQTRMDVESKAANVSGAFRASGLEGMTEGHVLIVDDVFTTGATLHACFEALRKVLPATVRISVVTLGFVGR